MINSKWLVRALGALILIIIFGEVGIYAAKLNTQKRAEALLFQARSWRLGETTSDNMQEIRTKYEVRKNADAWIGSTREQNYSVDISNGILNKVAFRFPGL